MPPERIPWRRWMEVGLGFMGLSPRDFWNMSLAEWIACYDGHQERLGRRMSAPLTRAEFEALLNRYPD